MTPAAKEAGRLVEMIRDEPRYRYVAKRLNEGFDHFDREDVHGLIGLCRDLASQLGATTSPTDRTFADADALATWLESLHECDASGAIGSQKWEPAQRAAAAIRNPAAPVGVSEDVLANSALLPTLQELSRSNPVIRAYFDLYQHSHYRGYPFSAGSMLAILIAEMDKRFDRLEKMLLEQINLRPASALQEPRKP